MRDDEPAARPMMLAQRMELRARWERWQVRHEFAPGQLVRQKQGIGLFKRPDEMQLMFCGKTDLEDPIHRLRLTDFAEHAVIDPWTDCFVAMIDDGGTTLAIFPAASYSLEPDPDA